jgi:hypothetical protein
LYPTKLLSHQFWSAQHLLSVCEMKDQERLTARKSTIESLSVIVDSNKIDDSKLKNTFIDIIDKVVYFWQI